MKSRLFIKMSDVMAATASQLSELDTNVLFVKITIIVKSVKLKMSIHIHSWKSDHLKWLPKLFSQPSMKTSARLLSRWRISVQVKLNQSFNNSNNSLKNPIMFSKKLLLIYNLTKDYYNNNNKKKKLKRKLKRKLKSQLKKKMKIKNKQNKIKL